MIKCLLADDEPLAREVLKSHIGKVGHLQIAATCSNGVEVYNALKENAIDLLFLDIQMPQLSGLELLRTVHTSPPVIITTAYREFALEGFELNVLDYLLKPISFERFLKAVDKYESWINPSGVQKAVEMKYDDNQPAFIYVKADKKNIKILVEDILYIEGLKDYVKIHTKDKAIITHQTLAHLEGKLPSAQFIRSHRSYIISLRHISAFTATEVEIGNTSLPIGYVFSKIVQTRLKT